MTFRLVLLIAALLSPAFAQTFEVASVSLSQFQSADGEGGQRESIDVLGDRLSMRNVTLRSCIAWAYNVQESQINGNFGGERFDITAKALGPSDVPSMRTMMTSVLADRFQLKLHRDVRQTTVLSLLVAKGGAKLHASEVSGPGELRPSNGTMTARHASMAEFAASLAGPLRTPVADKTGLTGRYDFTVDLRSYLADAPAGQPPDMTGIVTAAIREQLGLNLELRKESLEMLIIDHAERLPAAN